MNCSGHARLQSLCFAYLTGFAFSRVPDNKIETRVSKALREMHSFEGFQPIIQHLVKYNALLQKGNLMCVSSDSIVIGTA